MIKTLKSVFAFLGGVRFAVILIALTVAFVICGTLLESKTQSHKYAALWTYNNPVFSILLWGYFINILFSALRRWPFKPKHIPFLVTHFGLLMILGGVLIKNYYGTQGSMVVAEGTGSNEILLTDKPGLLIENRSSRNSIELPKKRIAKINELSVRVARYAPHAHERYVGWIKGPHAFILGLNPFIVQKDEENVQISGRVRFQGPESDVWDIKTIKSEQPFDKDRVSDKELWIISGSDGKTEICCKDDQGKVVSEVFNPAKLEKYIAYDRGFGGYTIPADIPMGNSTIQLETPLTKEYVEVPLPKKLEDLKPVAILEVSNGEMHEFITLGYDPHGNGMKWPALEGKYLFRFQPYIEKIPYFVRLHNGRQINYVDSNQPFSYESDISVVDTRDGRKIDTTLRMNHVHETWDGYRFYMSSISPADNSAIHRVQIVVNHDPAKYWLTYPGGMLVALGIGLLFFWKKDRRV